jgi:capsid protein
MSIDEAGMDEEEVDEQIDRDNEHADRLGLVRDSRPRKTDGRGQAANLLETSDGGDTPKPKLPQPQRKESTERKRTTSHIL